MKKLERCLDKHSKISFLKYPYQFLLKILEIDGSKCYIIAYNLQETIQ